MQGISGSLSNPKPGHTTGGSDRGGTWRGGGAGRGWAGRGRRRVGPPGGQPTLLLPARRRQLSWTTFRKHEQPKSYVNRWANKARGLSAVDNRFIRGATAALRSWLLTNLPSPMRSSQTFFMQGMYGNGGTKRAVYHGDRERSSFLAAGHWMDGYGRCGGSRYSWTRCGGSRIGLSSVFCSDPPWGEPPRVGNTGQGNCLGLFLGLKNQ